MPWIQAGAINAVLDRTVPKKIGHEGEGGTMIILPPGTRLAIAAETPAQWVVDVEARVTPGPRRSDGLLGCFGAAVANVSGAWCDACGGVMRRRGR